MFFWVILVSACPFGGRLNGCTDSLLYEWRGSRVDDITHVSSFIILQVLSSALVHQSHGRQRD